MKQRLKSTRRRGRKGATAAARRLVRDLPSLFKLVFRLLRDPRVSALNKALFGAVAVYMLTPVDLIPDFLGVFGWVDDLYLLGLALGRLVGSAGTDTLLEHWDGDAEALGYIVEGIEELGGLLPDSVREGLDNISSRPGPLAAVGAAMGFGTAAKRGPKRRVRRIRVDEEARVHIEE